MPIKDFLTWGGGGLFLLLTLVQIAPVKINPWSAIARWVGKAINGDVLDKLGKVEARLEKHIQNDDERDADMHRANLTVHRDYENKSCPSDYIYGRLGQIAKEVNQKLGGAPAGPFKAYQGQVNADDGLNCRTAPVSGQVRKTYPDGTVLTITKEDGNWGYCGEGWVCLDYINKIASAKDPAAKEEIIMETKLFKKMYDEVNPTYNTIEEVPSYWRADIKDLVDKGIIAGTGGGKLGLTKSDCKAAVLAKRIREKL